MTSAPVALGMAGALPLTPGVYRFRNAAGNVLYLGRATNLRRRVSSYWAPLRDRAHLAPMVAAVAGIEALACASPHEAAWLERNLLERSLPRYNRTPGGQETPVYLHLDGRPETPGLTLVHTPPVVPGPGRAVFGPYLGGTKVRQALAALHRVAPLAYTGTGLRGAEREMARTLGITQHDRDRLVGVITAVLSRDKAAVAGVEAELRERRDQAVATLSFEVAARVQAEIQALEWITSTQRVTTLDPADLDVHGWHDGVLVRLRIRAGHLSAWSQRPSTRADAEAHLSTTPAAWAEFAQHNAELAASLRAVTPAGRTAGSARGR